jgi:hypothetical protein
MAHPAVKFNNPVEVPSLDEIERMDKLREEAIEALEISFSADGQHHHVKCQKFFCYS